MSEHLRGSSHGPAPPELRLILLGNIGCGKTSSGDTILSRLSPVSSSAPKSCQLRQGFSEGRTVTLVEAPRWYWNGGKMEDGVRKETARAMTLVAPGPHAVLLLVPVWQFTEVEGRVPAELEEMFGAEVLDHTLVLLTCGDYLMGKTVEEYLQKEDPDLRRFIERCGGRYHVINNRQRQDRQQVCVLLEKVDNMVQQHGVFYMKTEQERNLEQRVKERKRELMESFRAQKEKKRESLTSSRTQNTETQKECVYERAEQDNIALEGRRNKDRDEIGERINDEMEGKINEMDGEGGERNEEKDELEGKRTEEMEGKRTEEKDQMGENIKEKKDEVEERTNEEMEGKRTEEKEEMEENMNEKKDEVEGMRNEEMEGKITEEMDEMEENINEIKDVVEERTNEEMEGKINGVEDEMEGRSIDEQAPEQQSNSQPQEIRQLNRTPSFRLNADGALLSQMSEVKAAPRMVTTFHHRINSFEENSPEASPTSSSHSPVFSSSSVPAFASSPSTSSSPPSSSSSELRLVMLGRSGSGKSRAGNAILGREEFESYPNRLTAVTQECGKRKALVAGRKVAVVDTPDWFNSERTPDEVRAQISSCIALASPGPHAFLLCVPLDQPAKTELQALRVLEAVFGPEAVQKYALVLFTHSDRLRESGKTGNDSVETYIASQRNDLLKLVEKCGDRFHVLEMGGGGTESTNVEELLEKVEQTRREAGGQCYSSPAFQEAENRVRQRQVEITKERRKKIEEDRQSHVVQPSTDQRTLRPYMQPLAESEEEVREDEVEKTRNEAEMSVSTMQNESLPPITVSTLSPSLLQSMMEKMESTAKMLPKMLADSSEWVGEGAKKVRSSPVWGTVGTGAQNVQKMVVEKVGARAGHVSKLVGDRVPKVVVDGSAWIGSGAKAAAASPMWGKVGSGAKSGALLVADGSRRLGAGIGAGAKTVAQSPVWGKVGSRAKMVAESSVWEKIGTTVKKVPKVVVGGAVLGLMLGLFLGGVIGGAIGAAVGSVFTEVGRRRYSTKERLEDADEATKSAERTMNDGMDSLVKQGEKVLKTE